MRLFPSLTFIFYFLLFIIPKPIFAAKKSYVVYMGGHSHGDEVSTYDLHKVTQSHYDLLADYLGSHQEAKEAIFYSYTRYINGFAAIFEEDLASTIAEHPNVISVFPNSGKKLHTTRSWTFLGLEEDGKVPNYSIWNKARFGEDTIIANLDTGVWPESKSFGDEGIGPIPTRWKGICQNHTHVGGVHCNRKLIGARFFNKGYLSALKLTNTTTTTPFNTPRDYDGHGTHTLSTAGGSFVANASVFGFGKGVAKGGSPRSRVAAYKVCWPPINGNECYDSDILAAFDAAIGDGVDVISASLGGGPSPYFNDSIAIGSFHALRRNIVVVCSAGNSGPQDGTVVNVAPWILTVGASTMDRDFSNWVLLGDGQRIEGQSLAPKSLLVGKYYPLVDAAHLRLKNASTSDAKLCKEGSLDPKKAKGKIVICLRGTNARVDKGEQVAMVGGVAMILANDPTTANEVIADPHLLPASHITYNDGLRVYKYLSKTKLPKASITHTRTSMGVKPAPFMAAFSSKGPNPVNPEILKPDITGPGVSVIAAYTRAQGPTDQEFDKRRVKYNSLSGTSMSCPHISGIVGLLKTLYPHWSPSAIKSAIMTTASIIDNIHGPITNASKVKANPFDYGSGHVDPNKAMDPGLVYDKTFKDDLNFLCSLGYNTTSISLFSNTPFTCPKKKFNILNLNYPSITVPNLKKRITLTRTLKNVGPPGKYIAHIQNPKGVIISINPQILEFKEKNEEKSFHITLKVKKGNKVFRDYVFGRLVWSDGVHFVGSPITVKVL